MIRKLQRRFILLAMTACLLVLAVIITGINIVNFHGVVREADILLSVLSENKGAFPMGPGGMGHRLPPGMSPEIPYESRFFSVTLDASAGTVVQTETSRTVSVTPSRAAEYAKTVLRSGKTRGFTDRFRYALQTEGSFTRITFLDCGRSLDAFRRFCFTSIAISLAGYLVVFGLIAFFSGRIIRPISESYEKQKRFITDAGHEIKTPLTIISADADVLAMELGENEWLEDIQKQAKRLTALTGDLVMLSRMEEAEHAMPMIEFPFSDVVSEAASSFQALAQTQGKTFQCRIQPMLTLQGNENAIRQLVAILLDNALKYAPENGCVSLTVEKQPRSLRLRVYNTTADAITKESLPLLFDRFYRTDPSRNSQTGGHGIGLSIAKAITAAHSGKIQASTADGHSLQITVIFPV